MKRYFTPALAAVGLCAAIGLAACGTTAGSTGTPGTTDTDTKAGTDAAIADSTDTKAGTDATSDTGADTGVDAAKDVSAVVVDCVPACTATQFCDKTGAAPKCVDIACTLPTKWGVGGNGLIQKMSKIAVTDQKVTIGGKEYLDGCDLDDDGIPNNVLGKVGSLYKDLNKTLNEKVADGTVVIALEPIDYKTDNSPFDFNVLIGDRDASDAKCDVQADGANCKYTVSKLTYDVSKASGNCPAKVTFAGAKVNGDKLVAKAPAFVINIPVVGINLKLTITKPQVTATVSDKDAWKSTKAARLCGTISKDDLNAAIDAVPDDVLKQIGDKATVKSLVGSILKPDIDIDNDGTKESISVSLDFETVGGQITGISPK
jgi:hypothetical protein